MGMHEVIIRTARNVSPMALSSAIQEMSTYVTYEKVERLRIEARRELSTKWHTQSALASMLHEKRFTRNEVQELTQRFGALHPEGRTVSRDKFAQIASKMLPQMPVDAASTLFDLLDEDQSDDIDFRALACCLSVLSKGSFYERVHLCFNIYDIDRSGFLDMAQAAQLGNTLCKAAKSQQTSGDRPGQVALIAEKIRVMDANGDDKISFGEFYDAIQLDPSLLRCFGIVHELPARSNGAAPLTEQVLQEGVMPTKTKRKKEECEVCKACCVS